MERNELSLKYINMRTGGITHHPCNDGVYLKSIIKAKGDTRVFFPTTTCMQIFDGMEYYSEMKLNIYKASHPDFNRQRENTRKLFRALGVDEIYSTRLIYFTDEVAVVDNDGIYLPSTGASVYAENYDIFNEPMQFMADAIITDRHNVGLVMYSADCPTAFLRDQKSGAIGVLHSSWHGFNVEEEDGEKSSIFQRTIEAMEFNYETKPENLEVTIFPCIGLNQFEVGEEVVEQFRDIGLGEFVHRNETYAAFIDLAGCAIAMFERFGVKPDNIEITPFTTADYGLNSYRMSPTNYWGENIGTTGTITYDYIGCDEWHPELLSDESKGHRKIRANGANLLIAIRD